MEHRGHRRRLAGHRRPDPGDLRHPRSPHLMGRPMNIDELVAIDVHTHAEVSSRGQGSLSEELDAAAGEYFKAEHRRPTLPEIAAYYRERKMACVVFTVDAEAATGTPAVPNEEVAEAAAANPDVIIPFASIDPHKGRLGAKQATRLVREYGVRGFKFHPNVQAFAPERPAGVSAVRGHRSRRRDRRLPHRPDRHRRRGPRRRRHPPEVQQPDARRRRRRGLPRHADHPRAPLLPLAGRGARGGHAQAAGLHRLVRLVAEVLPAAARAVRQHPAAGQGAVRLGLPAADPGPLAGRLRQAADQGRGPPEDPQGERGPAAAGLAAG